MGDGDVKVSVSKSYISDRPKRLAQAKVQRLSRKTKNRKTKKRYARNLSRGNIRPKMRRQTGLVRVTIRKAEKKKEIGDLPDIGSLRFENSRNRDGRGYTMSELIDLTTRGRNLERGQNILWDKANRKQIAQFDNQGKGRYVYSPSGFALNPTTLASKKNKGKIMANTLDIPRNRMTTPMQGLDWENPLSLFGYQDIPDKWRFGRNNVEGVVRGDLEEEPINFGTASEGEWAGIGRALMEGKNSSTSKNLSDKQKTLMGGLEEVIPPLALEPYYADYVNEAEDTAERIRRINEAHTATGYDRNFVTDLNPLSQSEVLSEGIPWRGTSAEYVAPPVNNKKMGYSVFNGLPMDLSFRLLKRQRQTELGEYGVDAPSSYGPVTEYHGTMDLPNVLNQGIRGGSPKTRSNRYVPKNLRNEESINYTTNDAEKARKFAEERALSLGLNPADVGVVGVRGRDLSNSTEMDEPDGGILENTKSNVRAGNIPREYLVQASEPMDMVEQLLKERRSAKALANKKKYDTKYESSPERVKYRVELNRERRRRGIYGSGNGKDVSHTKGGKLTLENQSTNRARHFKNRGTLRDVKVKKMTGEEYPIISDTHHPQDVPMSDEDMESYFNVSHLGEIADTNDRMKRKLMSDVLGHSYRGKPTFYLTPFNEETGFSKATSVKIIRNEGEKMRMIKIYRTPLFEDDERELHPGRGDENENIFHQYLNETGVGRNTMLPWWYRDNKIKRTGKEPSDDEVMMDNMASSSFVDTPFNEETGFSKMSCECGHCVGMDAVWKNYALLEKQPQRKKFDVYPSAYANGWAVQYCRGKFKGKKKK